MNKQRFFLMVMAVVAVTGLFAQANTFSKGDKVANLSIGLGSTIYGSGYSGGIPPIAASLEYGIKDELFNENSSLGVGGYLGFSTATWGDYYSYSSIIVGARGILHYQLIDNVDTYGGILLGYNISSSKYTGVGASIGGASVGGLIYAGFVGARYYFSPKFAAMAELGYGIAVLNLGVSIKL